MLATLGGTLALLLGLVVLLLPLLLPELSRPRDTVWGAVVLLLGLVLVTSAERLTGAPMLGVLCGGLLIGRLGGEVAQARWRQLTPEEVQRLASGERWSTALEQLAAAAAKLLAILLELSGGVSSWLQQRRQPRSGGKRWVRPDHDTTDPASSPAATADTLAAAEEQAQAESTAEQALHPAPSMAAATAAEAEAAAIQEPTDGTAETLIVSATKAEPTEPSSALASSDAAPGNPDAPEDEQKAAQGSETVPVVVNSFEEIDALLEAAGAEPLGEPPTGSPPSEAG